MRFFPFGSFFLFFNRNVFASASEMGNGRENEAIKNNLLHEFSLLDEEEKKMRKKAYQQQIKWIKKGEMNERTHDKTNKKSTTLFSIFNAAKN